MAVERRTLLKGLGAFLMAAPAAYDIYSGGTVTGLVMEDAPSTRPYNTATPDQVDSAIKDVEKGTTEIARAKLAGETPAVDQKDLQEKSKIIQQDPYSRAQAGHADYKNAVTEAIANGKPYPTMTTEQKQAEQLLQADAVRAETLQSKRSVQTAVDAILLIGAGALASRIR